MVAVEKHMRNKMASLASNELWANLAQTAVSYGCLEFSIVTDRCDRQHKINSVYMSDSVASNEMDDVFVTAVHNRYGTVMSYVIGVGL